MHFSHSPTGSFLTTSTLNLAVRLVAAGVDITVIRSWMGHAHLDTTNLYAQANLETKRQALNQLDPGTRPGKHSRWKQNDILSWLSSH